MSQRNAETFDDIFRMVHDDTGGGRGVTSKRWWALLNDPDDLPVLFRTRRDAEGNRCDGEYVCRVLVGEVSSHRYRLKNPHAAELGRLGGSVKSEAKAKAARANAKKGGWPKGRKRKP